MLHLLSLSLQLLHVSPRCCCLALRLPQLCLVLAVLQQHLLRQLMQLALYLRVLAQRNQQLIARLLQHHPQLLVRFPGLPQILLRLLEAEADAIAQVVEQPVEHFLRVFVELEDIVLPGSQRLLDQRLCCLLRQKLLLRPIAVPCSHKQRLKLLAGSHFIAKPPPALESPALLINSAQYWLAAAGVCYK